MTPRAKGEPLPMSPLPWENMLSDCRRFIVSADKTGNYSYVAQVANSPSVNMDANADMICRAVNSHSALLAALEGVCEVFKNIPPGEASDWIEKCRAAREQAGTR